MKIYSNQADNFINNLNSADGLAALIYGADLGAVQDYKNKLLKKLSFDKQSDIIELLADQIKHDPYKLLNITDEMNFFYGKKIIVITELNAPTIEAINTILPKISSDLSIIILAEELSKESKLRNLFENHTKFFVIPCYKDDIKTLKNYISDKFKRANIRLEKIVLDFLANNLGQDKMITNNEIEKILTYLGEQKSFDIDEVSALLTDNSELILSDISYSLALRNFVSLDKQLTKAFSEQISLIAVIRSCISHFQKLAIVQSNIQSGQNIENAIRALRPPVFFKQVDQFKSSIGKWNKEQIKYILNQLNKLEFEVKTNNLDNNLIAHHQLMKLINY